MNEVIGRPQANASLGEETIIENRNQTVENRKESKPWRAVSLGGVAGILMGAGAMYAADAVAQEASESETSEEGAAEESAVRVAEVNDNMSFSEAFESARAEVGPGGVFYWHGGIYNTYTATEWDAMSDAEKDAFAQRVAPEVEASAVSTPTDAQPEVVVVHHVHHVAADEVTPVSQEEGDVRIVGTTEVDGHLAVGYDTDGDGQADVAIIDVDDSGNPTDADVVVTADGDVATIGDIVNGNQPDVAMVSEADPAPQNDDVRIVGVAEYEGHAVVGIDMTGDNQADVAVIDVDDSGDLSAPDVVVTPEGDMATMEDLMNAADPNAGYYQTDNLDGQDYSGDVDSGQFV